MSGLTEGELSIEETTALGVKAHTHIHELLKCIGEFFKGIVLFHLGQHQSSIEKGMDDCGGVCPTYSLN